MSRSARALKAADPERRDPRAFCGDCFPWPFVVDLTDGAEVTACYLVHEKHRGETKHSKPYLRLVLGDHTGRIEAKVWDDVERFEPLCAPQEIVGVRGRVSLYRESLQLTVLVLERLEVGEADMEYFLPASPRGLEAMGRELDALLATFADAPLRKLLQRCVGAESELGRAFRSHPAAKRNHHAYVGGLLEHSLSVAAICDRLVAHYTTQEAKLDRDLLIAGALLHDIGKVRELNDARSLGYTTEGQLLGHIVLGIQIVAREAERVRGLSEDRLLHLQHLIASHQGRHEWASPQLPRMLEALLLHYADDLDSKMNPAIAALAAVADGEWSGYDKSLDRAFFRPAPLLADAPEVEPVAPREAAELLIDLFRA
ncbi:HD domain-containing protein [soil metagenome]